MIIEMRGITKRFGQLEVLKGIDLDINKGEVVSIVGPSGAGKTTLLQIMGTLYKPDSGSVSINGEDVLRLKETPCRAFVTAIWDLCFSSISCCRSLRRWKM